MPEVPSSAGPSTLELPELRLMARLARRRLHAALAAVAGVLTTGLVYLYGLFKGGYFVLMGADEWCEFKGMSAGVYAGHREEFLPMHWVCKAGDGSSFDLVPAWVNPVLAIGATTALACLLVVGVGLQGREPAWPRKSVR
jgi:hypothetical protein